MVLLCSRVVQADLAPDFTFTDIDGNTHQLSGFRGAIVILDFFATYCPSCVQEMGELETVHNTFGSNLVIVSISTWYQDTDQILKQFRDNYSIPWIVSRDTAQVWKRLYGVGSPGNPSLYTIDQRGYLRFQHEGVVTNASILTGEILGLLGDLNGDFTVSLQDLTILANAYGSKPGDLRWNSKADIDGDGVVGLSDLVTLAIHYGQHYP
jgi:peroxiredoxin